MSARALASSICVAYALAGLPASSHGLMANVEANGFSFSIEPAATSLGFTLFFTTFDGSTSFPLGDCTADSCTISSEFSPVSFGSTSYRSDYLAVDSLGIFEYGTLSMTISGTDSDLDGILDPLERSRGGNFTFSGTTTPHFNAFDVFVTSTFSGAVLRSAGAMVGTHSGTFTNPTQSASFAGAFALSGASGTVEYDIGGEVLHWNLSQRALNGQVRTFSGVSSIQRVSLDQIMVPAFSLSDSESGLSLFVQAAALNRFGNVFRGNVFLADGGVDTSWADYTAYRVEVTDPNDTNHDGVPDLSFVPEPGRTAMLLSASLSLAVLRCLSRGETYSGAGRRDRPR